jgi:hypothetical protein
MQRRDSSKQREFEAEYNPVTSNALYYSGVFSANGSLLCPFQALDLAGVDGSAPGGLLG